MLPAMRIRIKPHRFVFSRFLGIILWAGIVLLAVPVLELVLFRFIDPPCTPLMLARRYLPDQDRAIRQLRHQSVDLEQIDRSMVLAVLAAEDQNFLKHHGFDLHAIEMALEHNQTHRHKRGASTISQQTAKNVFLWEGRSWLRKALEVPLTLAIELLWGKRRILEVYLNVVEFGPGVFGVEAASQYWFHVPARRLSQRQAALLAASLPAPLRFNPGLPSGQLAARAYWVERQIRLMDQVATLDALDLSRSRQKHR
jgi:monofunctional glycosyltransferase